MKTKDKIRIAKGMYRLLHGLRAMTGCGDMVVVSRKGIKYQLDLSEGIDLAIYLFGQFERATAAACARHIRPGDTVVDIGANVGAHTLSLARLVGPQGRVIAVEPTRYAAEKLRRNISLNPDLSPRITVVECFLGPKDGEPPATEVFSGWPLKPQDRLHPKHGGQPHEIHGQMRALDGLLAELGVARTDFIKLDVDGHEWHVLAGARETIRVHRPTIIMELAPYLLVERGHSLEETIALMDGYRFYDERTGREMPNEARELMRLVPDGSGINVVARAGA